MATQELTGAVGTLSSTDDRKIRITVSHLDAQIVAEELREWMKLEYPQTSIETTREGVADSLKTIKRYRKWLERLNWGHPAGDVELKMPYRDARALTERLLATGGDGEIDDCDTRTRALQALAAGDHLAEQVLTGAEMLGAAEREHTAAEGAEAGDLAEEIQLLGVGSEMLRRIERERSADACRELAELTRSVAERLGPDNDHTACFIGWAERLELQDAALR